MFASSGRSGQVDENRRRLRNIRRSGKTPNRLWTRVSFSLVIALFGFFLVPACGDDPLTEEERVSAEVAIYATVVRQLVEFDNTFGADYRFSRILIVDHLDPEAGNAMQQGQTARPLDRDQRAAITAAIEHLAPVEFINDAGEFIRQDVLAPVIPGSVIITLAPVEFDDEGATVGANLWCGGTCGLWLTYRVTEGPDGWTVGGREGTWSIS